MSEQHSITGRVHHIGEVETFKGDFTKRILVIDNEGKYNNLVPIYFTKERTEKLDQLSLGELVKVSIDLGGREYNGKYYSDITGWRFEKLEQKAPAPEPAPQHESTGKLVDTGDQGDGDEIPF